MSARVGCLTLVDNPGGKNKNTTVLPWLFSWWW